MRVFAAHFRVFAREFIDGHRFLTSRTAEMVNKTGNQRASTRQYLATVLQGLLSHTSAAGQVRWASVA